MHEIKQQIAREQEKLEAIEHSEETARTRAQEFKQKTTELQKQIEQLQEERNNQHKSLLKLTEAKHKAQKEVNGLNYTIKDKQTEFDVITADIKQASKDLEAVLNQSVLFLTIYRG